MEAKSYGMQFLFFEKLISHWSRLRFLLAVHPCDHAVDSFPKWYDTWKSAQKWGRESQFFDLVIFLTNTKKFKNPWLGAPGTFFGLFQWCQGMFLKVPEGFQQKKIFSCTETLLLPRASLHHKLNKNLLLPTLFMRVCVNWSPPSSSCAHHHRVTSHGRSWCWCRPAHFLISG